MRTILAALALACCYAPETCADPIEAAFNGVSGATGFGYYVGPYTERWGSNPWRSTASISICTLRHLPPIIG